MSLRLREYNKYKLNVAFVGVVLTDEEGFKNYTKECNFVDS